MLVTSRIYQCEADYLGMHDLIAENFSLPQYRLYPSVADLDYWRYICEDNPDNIQTAQIWEDSTRKIIGFAWLNDDGADYVCHHQHRELETSMLNWVEQQRLRLKPADSVIWVNRIHIFDCDRQRQDIAQRRGYERTEQLSYYGKRDLSVSIPLTILPEGYLSRSISDSKDIEQRAALHEIAAGGSMITGAQYKTMMNQALSYRQDLDLVVTTLEGQIVAFCTAWFDARNQVGVFEPLGCHPNYRRKGLTRNLLYEGMRRLKRLGATAVFVSHGGLTSEEETDPALELNASVGFHRVGWNYQWQKQL